jgi:16S rRNA G966 N2-methylase RsmD
MTRSQTSSIENLVRGDARWCVLTADNARVLPALPEQSVAHIITDPPYDARTTANMRTHKGASVPGVTTRQMRSAGLAKHGGTRRILVPFSAFERYELVDEFLRIAQRWVIAFCAMEQLGHYQVAAGEAWVRSGCWHCPDKAPQFTGDRPAQACEGVAIMHRRGRKRWNGGGSRAFWQYPRVQSKNRVHPTQKPLELMLSLVEKFTDPGDIVLDPFCGSGTTGVAALRMGRRFLGIEAESGYARAARERLEAESRCASLVAHRAGQMSLLGASR